MALETFAVKPLKGDRVPHLTMAHWLRHGDLPPRFTIDPELELKAPDKARGAIRYSRHPFDPRQVQALLAGGLLVTRLGLTWQDRVALVVNDKLELKRLELLGIESDTDADAGGDAEVDALLASGGEVISVDLAADRPETYERITGRIDFEASRRGVERLIDASGCDASGLPVRWTVPRIERRDAVYEEIESFYSRWLLAAGACVIDPPRNAEVGGGIEALPLPACVRRHLARTHRTVDLSSPGIEPAPDPTMREGAEHIAERTAA